MGRAIIGILGSLGIAAIIGASAPAAAQDVRIISVDGELVREGRAGPVKVWPGQVVSLAADEVYFERGEMEYAYRPVEDFRWAANDARDDVCDPSTDCREGSNFEATGYGVNFYVPRNAPARIEIMVQSKFQSGSDRLVLINEAAEQAYGRGYDYGLGDSGWWTEVGGERVFVPYLYEEGWSPFVHGYWYWTAYGWTWYSYDPWGNVTDHYGHWRHHGVYGWVWAPDPLWVWRPAIVSFFFGDGFIGWWPYDSGWSSGYRHGYASGYDDGYWMGYWAGRRVGDYPGRRVRPGATCVADRDFYVPGGHGRPPDRAERGGARPPARAHDIAAVRLADSAVVERNFTDSVRRGSVGSLPGGGRDLRDSRDFVARRTGVTPSETPMKAVRAPVGKGSRSGFEPSRVDFPAPEAYRGLADRIRSGVGSAAPAGAKGLRASIGRPESRAPAASNRSLQQPVRGVAPAPVMRGAGPGAKAEPAWAPRARGSEVRPVVGGANRAGEPRSAPPGVRGGMERTAEPAVAPSGGREDRAPATRRDEGVQNDPPVVERRPSTGESPSPQRPIRTREAVRPEEVEEHPEIGLPVDRSIRPDERIRDNRRTEPQPSMQPRSNPVPSPAREVREAPRYQAPDSPAPRDEEYRTSRIRVQPQEVRPRTEVRAPAPETRREVPRDVSRPREEMRMRAPSGGGSSAGSSAPPAYVPPKKPKDSPAPAPARGGPPSRRSR